MLGVWLTYPACRWCLRACRTTCVQKVFVFKRTGASVNMVAGRDVAMEELLLQQRPYCPAEVRQAHGP